MHRSRIIGNDQVSSLDKRAQGRKGEYAGQRVDRPPVALLFELVQLGDRLVQRAVKSDALDVELLAEPVHQPVVKVDRRKVIPSVEPARRVGEVVG